MGEGDAALKRRVPIAPPEIDMAVTIHAEPVPLQADADGALRVAGTRIGLEVIVSQYREGASAETIAERFPVLTPADVHAALAYFLRHQEEVNRYLAEQTSKADTVLHGLGDRHQSWPEVRERLLERTARSNAGGADLPGG